MKIKLSSAVQDFKLRFDTKAVLLASKTVSLNKETIPLNSILDVSELSKSEIPSVPFRYHEISSINSFGLGDPYLIDDNDIEAGSEEERVFTKVMKGDISTPTPGTILIPKVRPHLGKFILVDKSFKSFVTRAFLEVRPKGIDIELLYSILKHPSTRNQMFRVSTIGKGYPSINPFSLSRMVRIPMTVHSIDEKTLASIKGTVKSIFKTLRKLRVDRDIIDEAFSAQLGIPLASELHTPISSFKVMRSDIVNAFDIRISTHFTSPSSQLFRQKLEDLPTIKVNRLCSVPIKLGTSPEPYNKDSEYYYLASPAMATEKLEPEKLGLISEDFFKEKQGLFGVEKGDVFLRRSGVSLGKVLYFYDDHKCIYSDFIMRIRLRDLEDAKYLAFWMRSSFFQSYLQHHIVIGKGPRNVYPYQIGRMDIPYPEKDVRDSIIKEIDKKISKNDKLISKADTGFQKLEEELSTDLNFAILDELNLQPLQ